MLRQRLIVMMLGDAKKHPPNSKTAFKRSALCMFDSLTEQELVAELKRIGERRGGLTKLIIEAWNEVEADRRDEEAIVKYWESVLLPKCGVHPRRCPLASSGGR
jgi:hypothetical protein